MYSNVLGQNPTNAGAWERPLGPLERWFYVMDQNRANHFSMAAEVVGELSPEECVVALAKLQSRHPLLTALIEDHLDTAPSFKSVPKAPIPLRLTTREGSNSSREELEKEVACAIDTTIAPLMRAVLLSGANRSEIIFTIHHSVADGTSLLLLMRDFFNILTGIELDALPLPLPIESVREGLSLPSPTGITNERRAVASSLPVTYRPPTAAVTVSMLRLSIEQTSQAVCAARLRGVTVHAALTAALVIAGRQLSNRWKSAPVRVFSPINLRDELRMPQEVALILGAGAIRVEVDDLSPFWEAARRGQRELAAFRTTETNFFLGQVLGQIAAKPGTAAALTAEHFGYELMLTNLGRVGMDVGADRLIVSDIWGPSVTFGFDQEQTVAALTFKGALHLTHTSAAPLQGLLTRAVDLLLDASQ